MAARCSSTRSPTCRARRRTRSCACWSTRPSSASAAATKVAVDVRIVSSTARNLEAEIAAGKFREDLYHRLSVVPIRVPPLAERREDIPELVDYFMEQISQSTGLPKRTHRRRRHGGAAIARLAGQRPPAAQQRRAADDPGRRRPRRRDHRQHAAAGRRLDGAGDAERQWRRAADGPAAARGARGVRARISAWRRSTASAATSRAPPSSSAWSARRCIASSRRWASARRDHRMSRIAYVNGRYLPHARRHRRTSRTAATSSPTASTKSAR